MKFSYHWLKELSGTRKSPDQLARLLMMRAFEVESVERGELTLENLVIGEIVALEQHPNADRLKIATVHTKGEDRHVIVCGAPNQKVVVALPGTILPGDMKIEEASLRGVVSQGMLCSERELGLGDRHEGILVLPADAPRGALFAKHYGIADAVLDIKVLPDRGSDALSYQGMAREIAALDGYAPRFAEAEKKRLRIPAYNRAPRVAIADKTACVRYLGLSIKGVRVTPSPFWLFLRLFQSGKISRNNVVDLTNYLMLLTGQPLHAFDADKLSGGIAVRRAKKGERLKLLSGETIRLHPEDIVIADQKRALALAGIMGGESSAVSDKTENIFLELAVFDPASIRRSRVRHGPYDGCELPLRARP
ncbi:MAG: phenylalanine--tRNA ligase subunit beta [Candidatus Moraniibacteriota bacterium]